MEGESVVIPSKMVESMHESEEKSTEFKRKLY